jgi:hypothetical protein
MRLNKKGVESLPLRYIIIALVAALVIGIALQFTGILKSGTISTAKQLNETLTEKTTCELDEDAPVVKWNSSLISCNASNDIVTIELGGVNVTDDCGVKYVAVELYNGTKDGYNGFAYLMHKEGTNEWYGTFKFYGTDANVTEQYNVTAGDKLVILTKDKAPNENKGYTILESVICKK